MIYFLNKKQIFLALSLAVMSIAGCKKYPNPPSFNEELDNSVTPSRKVIVISIDGVTGSELKTIAPPNIMALLPTSKYSFATFKSAVATDAATWTSMLTGVPYTKHLVSTDDFQPTTDPNSGEHDAVPIRRNVLDYIMSGIGTKTAFVSPWANLRNYVKVADYRPIVNTDQAAKDSTIALLGKYEGIGATVVNFREVEAAGANGGYLATNDVYKNAILKADGYIDEIIKAIKARKTYANEEWLFIITSNHGGSSENPTNGFLVVNNPALKSFELKKIGYNSVLFTGTSVFAQVAQDNGLYNAGNDKDFTVQAQVKIIKGGTGYVGFLSKGTGYKDATKNPSGGTGWTFGTWASQWRPYYSGTWFQGDQGRLTDVAWHTLTMTVKRVNATTRTAICYYDGVKAATEANWNAQTLTSTDPLRVGFKYCGSGDPMDYYVANLAYFQTALDAPTIQANLNLKDITKHPNYNSLIGFWKMDEGAEGTLQNTAQVGYNMNLSGNYVWNALGADAPSQSTFEGTTGYSLAPAVADIGALMMYWTKTKIDPVFDITGKPFIKDFEKEFLK